jgi:hypothetical protein
MAAMAAMTEEVHADKKDKDNHPERVFPKPFHHFSPCVRSTSLAIHRASAVAA